MTPAARVYSALRNQAQLAQQGAELAWSATEGRTSAVEKLEDESVQTATDIEALLHRSLSMPIDRDDLHRLVTGLVGVLDRTTHVAHAYTLYRSASAESVEELATAHRRWTQQLEEALVLLQSSKYPAANAVTARMRTDCKLAMELADARIAAEGAVVESLLVHHYKRLVRACLDLNSTLAFVATKHS